MPLRAIVGLGNPGPEYHRTRHNVGFMVLDALVEGNALSWQKKSRYPAQIGEWTPPHGERLFLLKPETYMNLSGEAVARFCKDRGLDRSELLVIHDDVDLPLGVVRWGYDRGAAGHRGVESLISHLGGKNFYRVRVGIGREGGETRDYVLERFRGDEKKLIDATVQSIVAGFPLVLELPWEQAVSRLNQPHSLPAAANQVGGRARTHKEGL